MTFTSAITPETNGATAPVTTTSDMLRKALRNSVAAAAPKAKTTLDRMTPKEAVAAAVAYANSLAGQDGKLTRALRDYPDADNETDKQVQADMLAALTLAYVMKRANDDKGVSKDEATRIISLTKYHPDKQDDQHRTAAQEKLMGNIRVMWHRARTMAGIIKPRHTATDVAEIKERAKVQKTQRENAMDTVHPAEGTDPNIAMLRFVVAMQEYQSANKALFTQDNAWRKWLASAPKAAAKAGK